jgi:cysteine desulfurase
MTTGKALVSNRNSTPIYLDHAATTPMAPEVRDIVLHFMTEEFGNAGSRTHDFGAHAKKAVEHAREQVAAVVKAKRDEVIFTSGATESNNIATIGLAPHGEATGRKHIVSTAIEHKAVIEPLQALMKRGFEVTFVPPTSGGWVDPDAIAAVMRKDTLLVSVMHVNNETGVIQPIEEIARVLDGHEAFYHVDAAQSFGKKIVSLEEPRIDLMSVSAHKIYGPKGVGALICRRRGFGRVPLAPLMFGGGQERGVRPGTIPVALVAGLGLAAELALRDGDKRIQACQALREKVLEAFVPLNPRIHGDPARSVPHILNVSFPGVDSEALMVAWKGLLAVSNGSACTSHSYEPSHVLEAMGLSDEAIAGAVRLSWGYGTVMPNWNQCVEAVLGLAGR